VLSITGGQRGIGPAYLRKSDKEIDSVLKLCLLKLQPTSLDKKM
jgi:hypothetical protein